MTCRVDRQCQHSTVLDRNKASATRPDADGAGAAWEKIFAAFEWGRVLAPFSFFRSSVAAETLAAGRRLASFERMNQQKADTAMLAETSSNDQQTSTSNNDLGLERQMAELDLSSDTRRFLRKFHVTEKKLNDAFDTAHHGGDLEERVSQVYHALYGAG